MGGVRNITIETNSGAKKFKTYAISETALLKDKIGESIIIWSYSSRDMFFIKRNNVIDIEVDGSKILKTWDVVRKKIESRKSVTSVLFGAGLMLVPLIFVYRLVMKDH